MKKSKKITISVTALLLFAIAILTIVLCCFGRTGKDEEVLYFTGGAYGDGEELKSGKTYSLPRNLTFTAPTSEAATSRSGIKLSATLYDADGANVSNAQNAKVGWKYNFEDTTSAAWAYQKDVKEYLNVTPMGESVSESQTVFVECLQAFGTKIELIAYLEENPEIKSYRCIVDYEQRVEEIDLYFGEIKCNFGGETPVHVKFGDGEDLSGKFGGTPNLEIKYREEPHTTEPAIYPEYDLTSKYVFFAGQSSYGLNEEFGENNWSGFHFFAVDPDGRIGEALSGRYNVRNGIYFTYNFFTNRMGMRFSDFYNYYPVTAGVRKESADFSAAYLNPNACQYQGMYNLFDLTLRGNDVSFPFELKTTFVISGADIQTIKLSQENIYI